MWPFRRNRKTPRSLPAAPGDLRSASTAPAETPEPPPTRTPTALPHQLPRHSHGIPGQPVTAHDRDVINPARRRFAPEPKE